MTIGSLVSMSVLVPFLIEQLDQGKSRGREFIDSVFTLFFTLIVSFGAILWLFMPVLTRKLFPGFDIEMLNSVVLLSRLMLLSPILLGISNLFGSITQSHNRFFVYAFAPFLYNIGIIFGIVALYPSFGLSGIVIGVIIGAFFHLAIQIPSVLKIGLFPRLTWRPNFDLVRRVVYLSLPRTLTLSVSHLSTIFLISFASLISQGSISVFNLSFNLQSVPLSIIGVSYSLAVFPTLSRFFTEGKKSEFLEKMVASARHIVFWSIPFTVLFVVLRAHIVRLVFGSGEFDWTDTRLTAAALAVFSLSLVFQGLSLLFVRGFYASNKTSTPFFVSVFSGVVLVLTSFWALKAFYLYEKFQYFFESLLKVSGLSGTGILTLALGFSIGSIVNGLVLWVFFEKLSPGFSRGVRKTFFDTFSASIIMGFVVYLGLRVIEPIFSLDTVFGLMAQATISGLLGVIAGISILVLLKNVEIKEIWGVVRQKFWKTKTLSPDAVISQF